MMNAHEAMQSNPILSAVIARIETQTAKGIAKYGEAVKPANLSLLEWIEHRQQEAVDQMVYMECIKQAITDALNLLVYHHHSHDAIMQAIRILMGVLPHGEGQAETPQDE